MKMPPQSHGRPPAGQTMKAAGNKRTALLVAAALVAAVLGFAGTGLGVAQTNTVTFSGTVTAPGGMSTDNVKVSVAILCWDDPCQNSGLPDTDTQLPRPLGAVAFLGETGVDSVGSWSVTVSGVQPDDVRSVLLAVWDTSGQLASRFISSETRSELWRWQSLSDIDVELVAGGRVSGRFTDDAGGPPPPGDYALVQLAGPGTQFALDIDPQTGTFTSPVVAPGEYSLAHGNHGQGHLTNNDAARFQITAGQTADVGTVTILQPGQITGTVTGKDGRALGGVTVSGRIASESTYFSYLYGGSPFSANGSAGFRATTSDDGTYAAQDLVPGDYQVEFEIPFQHEYTAIAAGRNHSCAIAADQTIDCWGGYNENRETDAPDGQYTAIAAGEIHACAIAADQTITCWGYLGYLGEAPDGQYTAIAAGETHACAIAADRTITCWGDERYGTLDAPDGQYTAIAAGRNHSCAIAADSTITCWGQKGADRLDAPDGRYTAIAAARNNSCAIAADSTITCWGPGGYGQGDAPNGRYTAIAAGETHACAIAADRTITCWGDERWGTLDAPDGQYTAIAAGRNHSCAIAADSTIACWGGSATVPTEIIVLQATVESGETTTGVNYPITDDETETDGETETAAERCFAVHKFGAQPVDVAKTANRETVLAQLSWGFHESIGCYLTLDEAALGVLQAAPAPVSFPAADPAVSQQCFDVHKFGAQPVDVAKSADRQTVLAQVRWGFHQSIGCYLTLDTTATAALRAAHT